MLGRNVVLFQHAARVIEMELPDDTALSAQPGFITYDDEKFDYNVWEEVPPQPATPDSGAVRADDDTSLMDFSHPFETIIQDMRQETLKLDLGSVAVHLVKSVQHETSRHLVKRHRSIKGSEPF